MTIMAFACALLIEPLVGAQSVERWRAVGERERKSGTHRLESATPAGPTLASLPLKTTEAAKSPEDLQAALIESVRVPSGRACAKFSTVQADRIR